MRFEFSLEISFKKVKICVIVKGLAPKSIDDFPVSLLVIVRVPMLRPIVVGIVAYKQVLPAEWCLSNVGSFNTGEKFNKNVETCKKCFTNSTCTACIQLLYFINNLQVQQIY